MTPTYIPLLTIPDPDPKTSPTSAHEYIIVNENGEILIRDPPSQNPILYPSDFINKYEFILKVGTFAGRTWYVCAGSDVTQVPDGFRYAPLRSLYGSIPDNLLGIFGRAAHLLHFYQTTLFCGRCGANNSLSEIEIAKICPACALITYPRISPAIIVRITDGDRILLARSPGFPEGMYSIIAGFVEPGESLEGVVRREVFEEVGVFVTDISYFGSQPWPFPDSLMIGFTARYETGEITVDKQEIEDARWFTPDTLPTLPSSISISRALIDDYLRRYN